MFVFLDASDGCWKRKHLLLASSQRQLATPTHDRSTLPGSEVSVVATGAVNTEWIEARGRKVRRGRWKRRHGNNEKLKRTDAKRKEV